VDLRRLSYFMAVAELGSFRRAAEQLHIAQSALSRRVQELEQEVGQTLLDRSGTRVRLLPPGEVLLRHARTVFKAVEDANQHLALFREGQVGLLRLGMTALVGQIGFVMAAIREFRQARPDVRLQLQLLEQSTALREGVRTGALDAAIVYGDAEPDAAGVWPLRRYDAHLALPEGHLLAGRTQVSLADLAGQDLISFSRALDPVGYDRQIAGFVHHGITPRVAYELPSEDVRLALVAVGLGISIVSGSVFDRPTRPGVVFRRVHDLDLTRTLSLMCRSGEPDPATAIFADIVTSAAGQNSSV